MKLFLAILFLIPSICQAAIAVDSVDGGQQAISGTTLTFNHTCTGSNLVLIVTGGMQLPGTTTITGVTYNGVAMTSMWGLKDSGGLGYNFGYILVNPATGTNSVVVTLSATNGDFFAGGISLTGVDQTTTKRTVVTASDGTGVGTTPTVTASDAQTGDVIVDGVTGYASDLTAGADQTSRWSRHPFSNGTRYASSTQDGASGGVMSWSTELYWEIGAVPLIPAAAASTTVTSVINGNMTINGNMIFK